MRRRSRSVFVGQVGIGGFHPVSIQSMVNVPIEDVNGNVRQVLELYSVGCEIVRLAIPKPTDVIFFEKIKSKLRSQNVNIPLVADVHFSPRIAYDCLGVADKIRINAGNFAEKFGKSSDDMRSLALDKFSKFFEKAKLANIPARIGVNGGSLSERMLKKYGNTARGMWESAYECVVAASRVNFHDLVLSFKASNVGLMVEAYRLACEEMDRLGLDYPLHLGVTEAGNGQYARIKSAIGIGSLLLDGIGDTIRVSLSEDPMEEIQAARDILQATGVRRFAVEFVACPSCGRTSYDMQRVLEVVKEKIGKLECARTMKIAIMGCVVNGLGEARDADYAIVGLPSGRVNVYKNNACLAKDVEPEEAVPLLEWAIRENS
ncbi:MAG: (E)-4-hydroxy-3-methylbut-2-enyl-diphosphate synthase [Puniceicoccales bacterium]|nr:(E)-4-hydroxy-3-methylbut-2-enyl-diphosphate synthase [Puniceicoccales bacterium]